MSWFRDPFSEHLIREGYIPIRHPREGVNPRDVLWRTSTTDFGFYAELSTIFTGTANVQIPQIIKDKQAANISGSKTGDLKIGIGLSIFATLISALGGKVGVKLDFKNAKSISFAYENVTIDYILPVNLDMYLNNSDINQYLSAGGWDIVDRDELYAVTTVVKCNKIKVEAKDESGVGVGVDIPVISEILGANVSLTTQGANNSVIVFDMNTPLVFGVKIVQIYYESGKFQKVEPVEPGQNVLEALSTGKQPVVPNVIRLSGYRNEPALPVQGR
jgi:hypothetical protein